MPRGIIILIVILVAIAGTIWFLSTQATETPTAPMEIDVTNAAAR